MTVRILDVNDHAPQFHDSNELAVVENQAPGMHVGHVSAVDLDEGPNGKVTFRLVPANNPQAVFHMPSKSSNGPAAMAQAAGFEVRPNGSIFTTRIFDREVQVGSVGCCSFPFTLKENN